MANQLLIRECREDEAPTLLELWRQSTHTSPTDTLEDIHQAMKCSAASVLVADIDGRIVGSVIGTFDGWRGNIYRIAVLPEARRLGVARSLLAEAETWMAAQGARRITALVEKDHPWATGFWNAAGYTWHQSMIRYFRDI